MGAALLTECLTSGPFRLLVTRVVTITRAVTDEGLLNARNFSALAREVVRGAFLNYNMRLSSGFSIIDTDIYDIYDSRFGCV